MAGVTEQQAQDPDIAAHIRERLAAASAKAHAMAVGTSSSDAAPAPGVVGYSAGGAPYRSNAERMEMAGMEPQNETISVLNEMAQPRVSIPALAQGAAARFVPIVGSMPPIQKAAGYLGQIPGTIAQRALDREPIMSTGTLVDLGKDLAIQAVGNKVADVGGAVVGKIAPTVNSIVAKLPNPRAALSRKIFGNARPGAADAFANAERMTGELADEVNRIRQGLGKPLLQREEVLNMTDEVLSRIQSQGVMTPANPTTGQVADYGESLGRSSVFTSRRFKEIDENQKILLQAYGHVFARSLGDVVDQPGSTEALAKSLASRLGDMEEARLGQVRKGYKLLDKIAGKDPVTIDPSMIGGVLSDMVTLREKLGKALPESEGIGKAIDNVTALVRSTQDKILPDGTVVPGATYTFSEARQLNSWLKEIRRGLPPEDRTGSRVYGDAIDGISERLRETLARRDAAGMGMPARQNPNHPPLSLVDLWKKTDAGFSKEIQAQAEVETSVLFNLLKGHHGAQVVPKLLGDQWEGDRVKFLYSRLGGAHTEQATQLRRWLFEDLLSRTKGDGNTVRQAIVGQDGGFSGESRWRAVLGDTHYKNLRSFLDTAAFVTAKNPEGNKIGAHIFESQLYLRLPQAVASGPEGTGAHVIKGMTYAITMRGLAKMLTNPATTEALATGVRGKLGSKRSNQIIQKALIRAMAESTLDPKEQDVVELPATQTRDQIRERHARARANAARDGEGVMAQ